MPIYEYRCESCGKAQEILVSVSKRDSVICGSCGSEELTRIFSSGFRVIGSSRGAGSSSSTCCGKSTPCASPKHCCGTS